MENFVKTFIAVVVLGTILYYVVVGVAIVKAVDHIQKKGVKSVIERIWEGEESEQK